MSHTSMRFPREKERLYPLLEEQLRALTEGCPIKSPIWPTPPPC